MERRPLLDTRLLEMVPLPAIKPIYARELARAQAWTYQTCGHFLAYSDEYVWRRLKAHRLDAELPSIRIRCAFCYVAASLADWAKTAPLWQERRDALAEELLIHDRGSSVRWLRQCDGAQQAESFLEMLDTLSADERAMEPPALIEGE